MASRRPGAAPSGVQLKAAGLTPKKSFGQNFLDSPQVLERIAQACVWGAPPCAVVEIGAGLGALTAFLRKAGLRVVAVERDRDLVPLLQARFHHDSGVELLEANALTLPWEELFQRLGPMVICGNLPYHLTSPLLFRALEFLRVWQRMVVMVQAEVADRMAAPPGSRTYGLLSVLVQVHANVEKLMEVPPGAFHPPPKVHSTVVRLTPRPQHPSLGDGKVYRLLARAAFQQRRKMLRGALSQVLHDAAGTLTAAGIAPQARAEVLSVEDFLRLAVVAQQTHALSDHARLQLERPTPAQDKEEESAAQEGGEDLA